MNKTELVAAIADQAELSKKDSEKALKAFIDVITDELKKEHKVQLVGFKLRRLACIDLHRLACLRIPSFSCSSLAHLEGSKAN